MTSCVSWRDRALAKRRAERISCRPPPATLPPLPRKVRRGWTCPYCGRSHPDSRSYYKDGIHGCGAARPTND